MLFMGDATAAVLHGVEDLRVENYAVPDVGLEDAVLRVEACGLCGTDHAVSYTHLRAHET